MHCFTGPRKGKKPATAPANGVFARTKPNGHKFVPIGAGHWADRSYGALDAEGHLWWFTERIRNPPVE